MMNTIATILMVMLVARNVEAIGNPYINTFKAEDGRSFYKTPLYCNYTSLYWANYYNQIRSTYTMRNDRNCCYLADSRNDCCVVADNAENQGCKCSPSITCGTATTTAVPSTTESTTTTTTSTTTVPTTTTTSTTTVPTTTTTSTTTVPTTKTTSRTTVPTTKTTSRATVPTTKTTSRATVPTTKTTSRITVPTAKTTTRTTVPTTKIPSTTTVRTTTTNVPTTTASKALCQNQDPSFRILNGGPAAADCSNSGVFNITFMDGEMSSCNAVYTSATVNGVFKPTILTAGTCKSIIDQAGTEENAFEIQIGNQRYKILPPMFTTVYGPSETAFIDIRQSDMNLLDSIEACQKSMCPYNAATMEGRVDFNSCKIFSWGISDSEQFTQNGLNEAALTLNEGGCTNIPSDASNTLCFTTVSRNNLICASDSGAPVYCQGLESTERILMGVATLQTACDETSDVKVLPYPG